MALLFAKNGVRVVAGLLQCAISHATSVDTLQRQEASMHLLLTVRIVALSIFLAIAGQAPVSAGAIKCSNFVGKRIDWFPPNSPVAPEQRGQTKWNDDAIGGMVASISWNDSGSDVAVLTSGNQNFSSGVARYKGTKLVSDPNRVIFAIVQEGEAPDDAVTIATYYPKARKLIWSGLASEFLIFKGGMHVKVMVADCQ